MATMTATYTWALFEAEIKAYLGVSGSAEDVKLQLYLAAAVDQGDAFCNNFFTDDDLVTGVDVAHEPQIKLGVFEFIKILRSSTNRGFAVTSRKTGDLSEGYAYSTRIAGGILETGHIMMAVAGYWRTARKKLLQ